jgi:hypothetical protein
MTWALMIDRCTNPANMSWRYYGGATPAVKVCKRWFTYKNWLADVRPRPEGFSFGRFTDVGWYTCGQCAQCRRNGVGRNGFWQAPKIQGLHRRNKNLLRRLIQATPTVISNAA